MVKKKIKPDPVPEKKRRNLLPVRDLAVDAHQIFMLKPNELIILNKLKEIYADAYDAGYQRRISDQRLFNQKRDARIKKSYESLYKHIEDTIHGGVVPKKEEAETNKVNNG